MNSNSEMYASVAIKTWKQNIERAEKLFESLSTQQLEKEVAPGKNRLIYLWGHLTAVHDAMLPLLGFGQRLHPELDESFIDNPDRSTDLPDPSEVRLAWEEVNSRLMEGFRRLHGSDWLERHTAVSPEDFEKDPTRNRLAILLSRTGHVAYHLGQAVLAK